MPPAMTQGQRFQVQLVALVQLMHLAQLRGLARLPWLARLARLALLALLARPALPVQLLQALIWLASICRFQWCLCLNLHNPHTWRWSGN